MFWRKSFFKLLWQILELQFPVLFRFFRAQNYRIKALKFRGGRTEAHSDGWENQLIIDFKKIVSSLHELYKLITGRGKSFRLKTKKKTFIFQLMIMAFFCTVIFINSSNVSPHSARFQSTYGVNWKLHNISISRRQLGNFFDCYACELVLPKQLGKWWILKFH